MLLLRLVSSTGAQAGEFAPGLPIGQVTDSVLTELSGIAASRHNPGVLWVHNDRPRDHVYAVSTNGQLLARWSLGDEVEDFEDIALGPGPSPELQYLYCGDIGDNTSTRASIRVYRAVEPAVYSYQAAMPVTAKFPSVEKFTLNYPDETQNAEALLVDPWNGDLYIATKAPGRSRLYRAEQGQLQDGATITLTFITQLDFHVVSGGDIGPDGQEIVLRQEEFALLWQRKPGQTVEEALEGQPVAIPVIGTPTEPNGEAIAFAPDGSGYYTVSEGVEPTLYFFARTGPLPARPLTLIEPGAVWRFRDDGSNQGTAWRAPEFADAQWPGGAAQFGYGDGDERTVIRYGANKDQKHVTTYFRKAFEVENAARVETLSVRVLFDDGVAVYLNGTEILRKNLAASATYLQRASSSGNARENLWQTFAVPNLLRTGGNVLAAEVHRYSLSENDLSFDLQLLATEVDPVLQFVGPPRPLSGAGWSLNLQGPQSAVVWVEHSTNFQDWIALGSLYLTNGLGSFVIAPDSATGTFYRLRR